MKTRILAACAALAMPSAGWRLPLAARQRRHRMPGLSLSQFVQVQAIWQPLGLHHPGAYCPAAAHNHYGLDKYNLGRKYWCKNKNGWRWES